MKKQISVFAALLFILSITNACAMTNNKESDIKKTEQDQSSSKIKEQKPFRFEDFKNDEEAEEVLLKIYPVGSDVGNLASFLENNGCEVSGVVGAKELNSLRYSYQYPKNLPVSTKWDIFIKHDKNKKLISISVSSGYFGV